MFKREQPQPAIIPEPEPEAAPAVEPEPAPTKGVRPVCMYGTREEKEALFGPPINRRDLPPRLISLGEQAIHMPGVGRNQKPKIQLFEGYVELGRVGNTWLREPGSNVLHPTVTRVGGEDEVLERFEVPLSRRHPVSGNHPDGKDDQKIPFPDVTPEEQSLARAMFARATGPSDPPPAPAIDPVTDW